MLAAHFHIFCTHTRAPFNLGCCKVCSLWQIGLSMLKILSLKNRTHSTVSLVTVWHSLEASHVVVTDLGQTWFALCSSYYINPPFLNFSLILRIRRKLDSKKVYANTHLKPMHAAQCVPEQCSWSVGEVFREAACRIALMLANRPISVLLVVLFQAPVTECVWRKRLLLPTFMRICLPCSVSQM